MVGCAPCEAQKNKEKELKKQDVINEAVKRAKTTGQKEVAIVKNANGSFWFEVAITDARCKRLECEYIRVL
jgi:predicted aspartyl protease